MAHDHVGQNAEDGDCSDLLSGEWLQPREVADMLKIDGETLRRWARQGTGPPYVKIAPATRRYNRNGLIAWMQDRMRPQPEDRAS